MSAGLFIVMVTGADRNSSFEVNTEGNIDIQTDKSAYLAGESAKVLFKTPFSGKMLVTMETDKIISTSM